MASPFHIFRKHQKAMLAVICLLAMFAFVFIGPWSNIGSGGAAAENKPVFTWKFGTVRESELAQRRMQRQIVNQFLYKTAAEAKFPGGQPLQFDLSEQRIVADMLLEKKAEQMGLVPSTALVKQFIMDYTGDKLVDSDYAAIIKSLTTRETGSVSQTQLLNYLGQELAVLYVQNALFRQHMARVRGDTPAERWQYFLRLNRKVTSQMLPVTVSDFVSEVKDPDEKTLAQFYDEHKSSYPFPELPTPGFRQPYLAQFDYFKADYATLVAEEAKKVTDQEIKKYYDDFKDFYFKKAKLPAAPATPMPNATDDKPADDAKSDDTKPDDAKANDTKSGEEKKPDDTKAGDAKSADNKSGDAKATEPKADVPQSDTPKTDAPKADGKQSRVLPSSLDGELLALADEPAVTTAATDQPKSDAKADSPAKADDAPKSDSPADAKSDTKADDKSAVKADEKSDDKSDAKTETKPDPRAEPVEYEPLEKVTDQIRDRVAGNKVNQRVSEAFAKLRKLIDDYRVATVKYQRDLKSGLTSAQKPEPPDLAALAKEYGLEAKTTELINILEARDGTDIGKSNRPIMAGSREAPSFLQMGFTPSLDTYTPEESEDAENNRYLWWKVASKEETVPPLADIKTKVTAAWKIVQARKLAEAKATELAAQVNKAKQPLKEVFANQPGKEVFTAGPFSWYTRQLTQFGLQPQLSEVSGVKYADQDFFKAVFALSVGEAGVAPNQPLAVYYVVQIEAEEPPLEQLREKFLMEMGNEMQARSYSGIGMLENRGADQGLLKELENQYGFKLADGRKLSAGREE